MSGLDLHPEELLDKAAAGALSDAERAHLGRHLEQCPACRLEQRARRDFAAAAGAVDAGQVDSLVARALAGLPARQPAFTPGRRRAPWGVAAAVALFGLASFAAVGQLTGVLPRLVERWAAPAPAPAPAAARPPSKRAPPRPPEPGPEAEAAPAPVPAPAPAPVPAPVPVPVPVRPVARPAAAKAAAPAPDAAELFAEGNAARIRQDRAEAALRYRELLGRFPSSDEARLTHATLGRLLLDSGDPSGALAELDVYLSLGDPTLREEAMSARARALALVGRAGDEAAAWDALLHDYPSSVHAGRARARLEELR